MKTAIITFAVLVAVAIFVNATSEQEELEKITFNEWMHSHGKTYESDGEFHARFAIFRENLQKIETHNAQDKKTFEMGLNQYSDMTWNEFRAAYLLNSPQNCSATNEPGFELVSETNAIPRSVDWRQKGVVTHVKNQGQCGSCWTFSTTGAMESHHALKTGKLLTLAEQQLVDCAQAFNNHGCDGGLPSQAFEYIHYAGGIEEEKTYPYTAKDGSCKFSRAAVAATAIRAFNVTQDDENMLHSVVGDHGPASIAYEVVDDFMHYKSGVYSSTKCGKTPQDVNHAVLAVGYNQTESGEPYWIVKNSWGESWGNHGYFWIQRGVNMCGLATCASFPIV